jgi:hypothetical protein
MIGAIGEARKPVTAPAAAASAAPAIATATATVAPARTAASPRASAHEP